MALEAGLLSRARPRALPRGAASRRPSRAARRASPDEPDAGAVGSLRPADSQQDPDLTVLVRQMTRYCESELSLYPAARVDPHRGAGRRLQNPSAAGTGVHAVDRHLPPTTAARWASSWLASATETRPTRLAALDRRDYRRLPVRRRPRQSPRASLQHVVGHLRAFLRFLASAGEIPTGSTPRSTRPACTAVSSSRGRCPGTRSGRSSTRSIARHRWGVATKRCSSSWRPTACAPARS